MCFLEIEVQSSGEVVPEFDKGPPLQRESVEYFRQVLSVDLEDNIFISEYIRLIKLLV